MGKFAVSFLVLITAVKVKYGLRLKKEPRTKEQRQRAIMKGDSASKSLGMHLVNDQASEKEHEVSLALISYMSSSPRISTNSGLMQVCAMYCVMRRSRSIMQHVGINQTKENSDRVIFE